MSAGTARGGSKCPTALPAGLAQGQPLRDRGHCRVVFLSVGAPLVVARLYGYKTKAGNALQRGPAFEVIPFNRSVWRQQLSAATGRSGGRKARPYGIGGQQNVILYP